MTRVRLMTYNIRAGLGIDDSRSISRIAEVIRAASAQVVCLQEVDRFLPRSGLVDQAEWLGDRLGMRSVYQRNYTTGLGGMGNAILSSLDVMSVSSHRLTSLDEPRGLLEVSLQTPGGPLRVFCTHLGLDAQERVEQAGEIAAAINAARGPKLLCGDLNEGLEGPALTTLLTSTGLRDAVPDGFLTFPSDAPVKRIDFVLHDPLLTAASRGVVETRASDHLPVLVDVDIAAR
jgi:endonuclease/exonuclease/phosphatase family metal-dependent hydrolase